MRYLCLTYIFVAVTCFTSNVLASWEGPKEIINGKWGSSRGEFGLHSEDMEDKFPYFAGIMPNGDLVIIDLVNMRKIIYNKNGNTKDEIKYSLQTNQNVEKYYSKLDIKYKVSNIIRYLKDGSFYMGTGPYYLKSPTGETLFTYEKRPLEVGLLSSRRQADNDNIYDTTVTYEDRIYRVVLDHKYKRFIRDENNFLYFYGYYTTDDSVSGETVNAWFVIKFNPSGRRISKLVMPVSEYESLTSEEKSLPVSIRNEIRNEYGPPLIGPDGSVYCWKRTPENFSILKWSWVEDRE